MPIYAYRCRKCAAQFDVLQKISDAPLTTCEECNGPLEKLMTAAAFHLKGSGWYKDGYASARGEAASSGESADNAGSKSDRDKAASDGSGSDAASTESSSGKDTVKGGASKPSGDKGSETATKSATKSAPKKDSQ